ncbi:hypothetical protein M378DRAFT_19408 [Amanita muscaria Koide BX008]|uniref:Uncharacterized protein n=1 Tax=Amanita muscaria (strain Koide BX008) TaxID=946122 RepID=A0A0C2VYI3_AMAMK|nr:hypothetical protein M378DRAFT_19408 [Amanita muscaria Koide BX008]
MNHLAGVMAADSVVPSPERKRRAIEVIEDDGDLSDNEMNKVYKMTARTSFVQSEINDSVA